MNWEAFTPVASIIFAVASTGAGLGWWLSGQFLQHRKYTYELIKEMKSDIIKKLEYHEQHDDSRFNQVDERIGRVRNDIWEIRLRNASKDEYLRELDKELMKTKRDENEKDKPRSKS